LGRLELGVEEGLVGGERRGEVRGEDVFGGEEMGSCISRNVRIFFSLSIMFGGIIGEERGFSYGVGGGASGAEDIRRCVASATRPSRSLSLGTTCLAMRMLSNSL
jgi:hypothetical protein